MSSSRKRTEGNDRNLENRAREEQVQRASPPHLAEIGDWEFHCRWGEKAENVMCSHDCVIPPPGHPVDDFMDTFYLENLALAAISSTFLSHHEVWKDTIMRKMAIDILLRIGTNYILRGIFHDTSRLSGVIIFLEQYDGEDELCSAYSRSAEDFGYLCRAGARDVVRFYYKRIPCSCLEKLYSIIKKNEYRVSKSFHCKQTVK